MQAFTLQCAGGSGVAAGASVAACAAAPDDAEGLGVRSGAIIGAPRFAGGAVGTGGFSGAEIFGWTSAGAAGGAGAAGVFGTATIGLLGGGGRGGAAALNPALVSTIGDMGADTQSSPSSTLPSAINSTAP